MIIADVPESVWRIACMAAQNHYAPEVTHQYQALTVAFGIGHETGECEISQDCEVANSEIVRRHLPTVTVWTANRRELTFVGRKFDTVAESDIDLKYDIRDVMRESENY